MTRPDSYQPLVDIIKGDIYKIILDVPGLGSEHISLQRQNVYTILKGFRKREDYEEKYLDSDYEKSERKFGEFEIRFKIPEAYDRKWSFFEV